MQTQGPAGSILPRLMMNNKDSIKCETAGEGSRIKETYRMKSVGLRHMASKRRLRARVEHMVIDMPYSRLLFKLTWTRHPGDASEKTMHTPIWKALK